MVETSAFDWELRPESSLPKAAAFRVGVNGGKVSHLPLFLLLLL